MRTSVEWKTGEHFGQAGGWGEFRMKIVTSSLGFATSFREVTFRLKNSDTFFMGIGEYVGRRIYVRIMEI